MKKIMVRMLCIFCILLLCSACGRVGIRDEFESKTLTEEIARSIVLFYNSAPPVSEFTEDTAIPYERAFLYFSYAGLYNADGSLRKAVEPYRQGDGFVLPAALVENYLSSKFNTEIDRASVSAFDATTEQYTVHPQEKFAGEIAVDSVTETQEGQYRIIATVRPDPQNSLESERQTFTVAYDGEYRFLSFASENAPLQQLTAEEQMLVDCIEDYYLFSAPSWEFDAAHPLSYDQAFLSFSFWDGQGNVREDLRPYAIGDLYEDPYLIPSDVVETDILSRFDVKVDRALIDCYDAAADVYRISPEVGDSYEIAELTEYEKQGDVYTVLVNRRHFLAPSACRAQHFRLEIKDGKCKYLSALYVEPETDGSTLAALQIDFKKQMGADEEIRSLQQYENKIYLETNLAFYEIDPKTKSMEKLTEDLEVHTLRQGALYYIEGSEKTFSLFKMDLKTKERELLCGKGVYQENKETKAELCSSFAMAQDGGIFYTMRSPYELRYFDGKNHRTLFASESIYEFSLSTFENQLYYVQRDGASFTLYRYDLVTNAAERVGELADYRITLGCVDGYYYYKTESNVVKRIKV